MTENKRYTYNSFGEIFKDTEIFAYSCSMSNAKAICKELNEQEERITELEKELQNLQKFKKILEFTGKDMEERADWQAYCEKEFEGL